MREGSPAPQILGEAATSRVGKLLRQGFYEFAGLSLFFRTIYIYIIIFYI